MDLMELKLNELVKKNKKELIEDIKSYIQDEFRKLNNKNYHIIADIVESDEVEENTNTACDNIITYLNKF